jgi:hypothetical protein
VRFERDKFYRVTYQDRHAFGHALPSFQARYVSDGYLTAEGRRSGGPLYLFHIFQRADAKRLRVRVGTVISSELLSAREMVRGLALYDRVLLRRRGTTYNGMIVGKRTTRVCVAYRLHNGDDCEEWVPVFRTEPLTNPVAA